MPNQTAKPPKVQNTSARPSIGALVVVILLAGSTGFLAGRMTSGLDARVAASSAAKAQADIAAAAECPPKTAPASR